MKSDVLLSWIGQHDLNASESKPNAGKGPIGQAALNRNFSHIFLLSNYNDKSCKHYVKWLQEKTKAKIKQ